MHTARMAKWGELNSQLRREKRAYDDACEDYAAECNVPPAMIVGPKGDASCNFLVSWALIDNSMRMNRTQWSIRQSLADSSSRRKCLEQNR